MPYPPVESTVARRRSQAAGFAVVLLALVAYVPAFSFEFVNYDDPRYVTQNPHVAGGLTPAGIAYAWTSFELGNWIPLTWVSYLLDATLFGIRPAGFHGTSIIGHAVNSGLLFYVLRRMTGSTIRSMVVAALFAVHPLHIQSVAWVSERKDILSTLFLLLSVVAYERYAAYPSTRAYACVAGAMALGLLCKPMLVTLPLLLLLLDFWPLCRLAGRTPSLGQRYPRRSIRDLVLEKIPLLCLAAADGVITVIAQRSVAAIQDLREVPLAARIGNATDAIGWYLWKTIIPVNLSPFYPHQGAALSWKGIALSAVTIAGLSFLAGWQWNRRQYLLMGWLWFLIALLPVLGLVQVGGQAHADRYSYVPHIGLFVMAVWSVAEFGRLGLHVRYGLGIATVVIVAASFATLRHELTPWHDSRALWERALRVNPDSELAHHNMGDALLKRQCLDEAKAHFQRALALNPNHVKAILALASFHLSEQNLDEARAYVDWASRLSPDDPQCRMYRDLLKKQARATDAIPGGTRPDPSSAARDTLRRGLELARKGDMAAAESEFVKALEHAPDYVEAHNNLGLVLFERGRIEDAESHFRSAIDGDPDNADFACNLALLLESESRWGEAIEQLEKVLALKPTDAEARIRLERLRRRGIPPTGRDLRQ